MSEFKLSATLKGHEDDVRAVVFPTSNHIISASRDSTVRLWRRITDKTPPEFDDTIATSASGFVNSATYVPPSSGYPDGLIVSGGKDTLIDVRQPGKAPESDADRLLIGHQGNVCALDVSLDAENPYLVSGSWDATAMVWDIHKGESTATLDGHGGSVWGVLAYDAGHVITACADKAIRIFTPTGKLVKTVQGASDVVRALCKLPSKNSYDADFASAGNDGIIRLWNLEGQNRGELYGHENFIYSLAVLPSGELVSSGEDRTLRIWRGLECVQTITHPAISVWSVAACTESGDIVTGASDRIVRVFTRSPERQAAPEAIEAFDDSIKQSSIPQQAMPDINKEKLPRPDFLQAKSGTKDGQIQMIHEYNGTIGAYQWSTAKSEWVSVGTVVDSAGGSGSRQQYNGQDYDYVFDVDIKEGAPPLKLPYNLSQNAFEVAQKFIVDNELPAGYVEEVARFILKNTEGATISQSTAPAASEPPPPTPRPQVIPQKEYLKITTANFPIIRKKIEELNEGLVKAGRKDICLNPQDITAMQSLTKQLEPSMASPNTSPTLTAGLDLCARIVTQWPFEQRIPGLDLLRCLAAATPATASPEFDILQKLHDSSAVASDQATQNTTMLALRLLANLLVHAQGQQLAQARFSDIYALARPSLAAKSSANRNVQIAATTLYINYAVLFLHKEQLAERTALLNDLVGLLADPAVVDSETQYRALVAVGTLLSHQPEKSKALEGVEGGKAALDKAVKRVAGVTKEPRIKACVAEVEALL